MYRDRKQNMLIQGQLNNNNLGENSRNGAQNRLMPTNGEGHFENNTVGAMPNRKNGSFVMSKGQARATDNKGSSNLMPQNHRTSSSFNKETQLTKQQYQQMIMM